MAQLFHPRFGLFLKLTLLTGLLLIVTAVLVWRGVIARPFGIGEPVEQIVPFSHAHHVGQEGFDCRYCHTSVETSAFAGIPPTKTCMTCHSQLYTDTPMLAPVVESWRNNTPLNWQRVHDLPGFVYFNHSIHVNKGVGCVSCHGRIDQMPLTWRVAPLQMQWCLDCHRAPEQHLRPLDQVFNLDWQPPEDQLALGKRLIERYHIQTDRLTDCSICHR